MQDIYYKEAHRLAQKEYKACLASGRSPCLPVLDDFVPTEKSMAAKELGLIQIPVWFIVGTKTRGRVNAFAPNFMPILEETTEFADKWEKLCRSHLSEGIREPIKVYEYMNRYYVEEGNKRVSVLKYFKAYSVQAYVTRVLPEKTDDEDVQRYYEYLEFNKASGINFIEFKKKGGYKSLLKAMGKAPDEKWTEDEQKKFSSVYYFFEQAYIAAGGKKLSITVGDAMLSYIKIYGYHHLASIDSDSIKTELTKMWEEVELTDKPDAIELKPDPPKEKKQSLLSKVKSIVTSDDVMKVAFIYDAQPSKSGWIQDHERGRLHVQTVLGDRISTSAYIADGVDDVESKIEKAISDGCKTVFTVSPRMLQASLKAAIAHPEVVIMNCSLHTSHRYVRTYYTRMYEVKFILGALAGSLTQSGRLGYVCDYPIYGRIAGINAFALGAQMANPRAKVFIEWSCIKGAKEAAKSLRDNHIHIISSQDTARYDEDDRMSYGLSHIGRDKTDLLAVPVWKWGVYYEEMLRRMLDKSIKHEYDHSERALNYYWGMSAGVVDIEYSPELPLPSRRFADFFRECFIHNAVTPFMTPFVTRNGDLIGANQKSLSLEQIIEMDYLVDNVEGGIPTYDKLNDIGKETVENVGVETAKTTADGEEVTTV